MNPLLLPLYTITGGQEDLEDLTNIISKRSSSEVKIRRGKSTRAEIQYHRIRKAKNKIAKASRKGNRK